MDKIQLTNNIQAQATIISNDFIDHYMIKADGEFVKIYLLLLRLVNQGIYTGPDQIADFLNLTQKDVLRAFLYWEKEGLLEKQVDDRSTSSLSDSDKKGDESKEGKLLSETADNLLMDRQLPDKSHVTPKELQAATAGTDLEQTIFMTETYIGRPLSHNELESFYYMENQLHFSADLLEYLIEYCVTRGKRSIRYMESVAISWYQQGIDTVKKAKEESSVYSQNVFPILKAFGIVGRNPAPTELSFIKQWNQMGFDQNIIIEACNRTMMATHQSSFPYANKILEQWKKQGVRSLSDIQALDDNFRKQKPAASVKTSAGPAQKKSSSNAFHNFDERSYDYDDLEARLRGISQS